MDKDKSYTANDLSESFKCGGLSMLYLVDKAIKVKKYNRNDIIYLIKGLIKERESKHYILEKDVREIIKKNVDKFCNLSSVILPK